MDARSLSPFHSSAFQSPFSMERATPAPTSVSDGSSLSSAERTKAKKRYVVLGEYDRQVTKGRIKELRDSLKVCDDLRKTNDLNELLLKEMSSCYQETRDRLEASKGRMSTTEAELAKSAATVEQLREQLRYNSEEFQRQLTAKDAETVRTLQERDATLMRVLADKDASAMIALAERDQVIQSLTFGALGTKRKLEEDLTALDEDCRHKRRKVGELEDEKGLLEEFLGISEVRLRREEDENSALHDKCRSLEKELERERKRRTGAVSFESREEDLKQMYGREHQKVLDEQRKVEELQTEVEMLRRSSQLASASVASGPKPAEIERLRLALKQKEKEYALLEANYDSVSSSFRTERSAREDLQGQVEELQGRVDEYSASEETHRTELTALQARLEQQNEAKLLRAKLEGLNEEIDALKEDKKQNQKNLDALGAALEEARKAETSHKRHVTMTQNKYDTVQANYNSYAKRTTEQIKQLEKKVVDLEAEVTRQRIKIGKQEENIRTLQTELSAKESKLAKFKDLANS